MIVILVAALIIFGPGKLPEVAGQMGRAVRDFRRMTSELTGEFEKTISDASDVKRSVSKELTGMKSQVASVSNSVKRDLSQAGSSASGTGGTKSAKALSSSSSITAARAKSTAKREASATSRSTPSASVASGAKTASRTTTTNGSASLAVASKADPFADLAVFDESGGDAQSAAPSSSNVRTPLDHSSDSLTAAVQTEGDDRKSAINRARQRRHNAGYNRQSG
ncbi:MAG: twin-arginine translocase TatA/TatE family subunit [Chloroflexota bacterium]|nr:twin-arginine translocase TatA/TatE family subunit [Chloroflexota bacterium]